MTDSRDPWFDFAGCHGKGEKMRVPISKVVSDTGLFCDLEGGIYGIVHLGDIDWRKQGEDVVSRYQAGDLIDVVVLQIDAERQRVSLGIKQLKPRPDDDAGDRAEPAPVEPRPGGPKPESTGGARVHSETE